MILSDFLRGFNNIFIFNITASDAKSAQLVVPANKGDVHSSTESIQLTDLVGKKIRENEFYILNGEHGCLVFSTEAFSSQCTMLHVSIIGTSYSLDFYQAGKHVRTVQFISSEASPDGKSNFYKKGERLPMEGNYSNGDQAILDIIKSISQIDISRLDEFQPVLSFKRKIR